METDRTQALIGFVKSDPKSLRNLSAAVTTNFGAIVLSSLDDKPLASAARMLLTAGSRVANTDMKWNDTHTRLENQGVSPSLIEPVAGTVTLRNLASASAVSVSPLDGAGHPSGDPIQAKKKAEGWTFPVGTRPTTWYVITITRASRPARPEGNPK